uniref:Uncharacterized protein n=1 Tax=Zea mays TaxID=4577 RepID=C4J4R2_MAIZE|nr:unknown [Zea mays]
MSSCQRSSTRSSIASACSPVANDDRIAMKLPRQNQRKSILAGLTLPMKYPPRLGMKSNIQSGIDSGITLNLFRAVCEYSSVL